WFTERIDSILTREGIDLYRQDCNLELSPYWNKANAETPDRQGLVEQKHLVNLLGMWDELQRRHPNLILDTCASGGRRIDLEFMRRSVPLWRTDRAYLSEPSQAMTYGLSFWFPFTGTGTVACQNASYYGEGMTSVESYAFWSNVAPSLNCTFDVRAKLDYEKLRVLFSRLKRIQPFMFGDFYPLTEWSLSGPDWIGWQFDVPERGEGCLLLFRHPASQWEAGRFPLRGLDPKARYRLESVDGRGTQEGTGEAFLQEGVRVEIEEKPGAAIWVYRRDSFEKVP
ncbi:MAG TPA: alpha-galactosidase, partial [Candidatus Sumerlaeota bacterium]|nr:alpha-galactosidase [Candidatus Sumerlaeota bacterium]